MKNSLLKKNQKLFTVLKLKIITVLMNELSVTPEEVNGITHRVER